MPSTQPSRPLAVLLVALAVGACGDSTGPNATICDGAPVTLLAPGAAAVIDPLASGNCTRLPAGTAATEYLLVALSGNGDETPDGVSTDYRVTGGADGGIASQAAAPMRSPLLSAFAQRGGGAARFHALLRQQDRALSELPEGTAFDGNLAARAAVPPTVGDKRSFNVCSSIECTGFVTVAATAQVVGQKVAIYLDDAVPLVGGYTAADLLEVGQLFDDYLYPIDLDAFGPESDIDNNGVVIVLLSDAVNALSGTCADGSIILGYFFSLDLRPTQANSNGGEVFYGLVPDPANTGCDVTRDYAKTILPPTFIHELQHMISYNQHVLIRGGLSEDTWLNEGLSHFAEELGGRKIPNDRCAGTDCLAQFAGGDVDNAYQYLLNPEQHYLVEPGNSGGTLEERGANWLFVRWTADHFGTDEFGSNVTRALVQTNRTGGTNVAAVTGQPFPTLASLWHLANYLDDLPDFTPADPRLQYESWNFRGVYAANNAANPAAFPRPYPLVPDVAPGGVYDHIGTLRGGSGHHVLVTQTAGDDAVTFRLTNPTGLPVPSTVVPRVAVVRIR